MKQHAPNEPLSFSSLEGFVVGKITVEALRRTDSRINSPLKPWRLAGAPQSGA